LEKLGSDKLTAKAQKITIKLPWEITTIYSEVLKQSGHQSDDEEDEDDIEAHEASIQRLKVRLIFLAHYWSLLMYFASGS
jgi:transcription initiation protein SPT3